MDTDLIARLLDQTLEEAEAAGSAGTEPVGSIVTRADGKVIGRGRNRVRSEDDPTAHAEVDALRATGPRILEGAVLVTSAEPCLMCLGAIILTPIDTIVWATDWVRDSAYAAVSEAGYERQRVQRLHIIREPSERHRAWTRRLLSNYYQSVGEHDLADALK